MKPNLLLLVHVEEPYRHYFRDMYIPSLIRSCRSKKYSQIIHMSSMIECDGPIKEITPYIDKEIEWAWGYCSSQFSSSYERRWLIGNNISDYERTTWIPPDFRNDWLHSYKVFLGGGYKTECLTDMQCVLHEIKVRYQIIPGLVYGE